jgi:8-oxo-dGTP diphosphatase
MSWERLPVRCEPVLPGTVPVLEWLAAERLAGVAAAAG